MLRVYIADTAALQKPSVFQAGYELLPLYRSRKVDDIKVAEGKKLSVGVGLLLRKICLDLDIAGADETLIYGENGKPYFSTYPQLFFNLAHSGERVMAAVADREIGCDTERIKTADLRIARRFFVPEEYEVISRETVPEKQNELFFRFWTAKESLQKCTGKGFALHFDSFTVDFDNGTYCFKDDCFPGVYRFSELDFADGYRYAYCIKTDSEPSEAPEIKQIDFNKLLTHTQNLR